MKRVSQKHEYGCAVACIAMISGKTYDHIYSMTQRDLDRAHNDMEIHGRSNKLGLSYSEISTILFKLKIPHHYWKPRHKYEDYEYDAQKYYKHFKEDEIKRHMKTSTCMFSVEKIYKEFQVEHWSISHRNIMYDTCSEDVKIPGFNCIQSVILL